MMLRPQDVLLAVRSLSREKISASNLSAEVGISTSEAYKALDRCRSSGLIANARTGETISRRCLSEIVCYAIPSIYYAQRGSVVSGMRTAKYATCLDERLRDSREVIPLVWPCEEGDARGETLLPLYPTIPEVARKDEGIYEIFAMIDVIRVGNADDRRLARELLDRRIRNAGG